MLIILFTLFLIIVTLQTSIVTINTTNIIKQKEKKKIIKIFRNREVLPYKEGKHR